MMSYRRRRKKVPLKPGHSHMHWMALVNKMPKPRYRVISREELSRHDSKDDAWTSIRGMVYNISHYLDFHPGGVGELMRVAGIDGTDLFDEIHRWVNIEMMMEKCCVGSLQVNQSSSEEEKTHKQSENCNSSRLAAAAASSSSSSFDATPGSNDTNQDGNQQRTRKVFESEAQSSLSSPSSNRLHKLARSGATQDIAAFLKQHLVPGELMISEEIIDALDDKGRTALMRAAAYGHLDCVNLLLSAKANVNLRGSNNNGWTALFYAASHGHEQVVASLLDSLANPNDQDIEDGMSPLCTATMGEHLAVVETLINSNIDLQIDHKHNAQAGNYQTCNQELQASNGKTALDIATELGNIALIQLLTQVSEPSDDDDAHPDDSEVGADGHENLSDVD